MIQPFYTLIKQAMKWNREIKKSKKRYEDYVNNIKKTWDGIKEIVNLKKTSKKTTQLNIGGKVIDNDNEITTNFNNFFVNVGPKTEKSIPKVPNILYTIKIS